MDGILKAPDKPKPVKAGKAEEFRFLFPGPDTWELWKKNAGDQLEFVSPLQTPGKDLRWSNSSFLAVPVSHVVIISLWLGTTDSSLMAEMIWLQLERKGLINGSRDQTVMAYKVVRQEEGRTLISVSLLSENFPDEFSMGSISRYPLSAEMLSLPSNQLIVWRELGMQVFIFTSGLEMVYAQSFNLPGMDDSIIQEAYCAYQQLFSEKILTVFSGITAFGNYSRQDLQKLGETFGVPVVISPLQLKLPVSPLNLTPASVRQDQKSAQHKVRSRRLWALAALVYGLVMLGIAGNAGWLLWKTNRIEGDLELHRKEVQTIMSTAQRWEAMDLALIPETYAVEMLFRCTQKLPEDGVRLIAFDQTGTRILMTGEAKSSSAAFQFLQDLKKAKDLAAYQWDMPPPKLLPNDAAQFLIEGKRSYAPVNSK